MKRIIFFMLIAFQLSVFLCGCDASADKLVAEGDRKLASGDRMAALEIYQKAVETDGKNKVARRKYNNLRDEIILELLEGAFHAGLVMAILLVFYLSIKRWIKGRKFLFVPAAKLGLIKWLFDWTEAAEVQVEFEKACNCLISRGMNSYLRPLGRIFDEFMQMRDTYIDCCARQKRLENILQVELRSLEKLAKEAKEETLKTQTIKSAEKFRQRIVLINSKIDRFITDFFNQKRDLQIFLISLRTRIEIEESFDGRGEIESLVRRIESLKKTFKLVEDCFK
ncbi:MAG: hypothetical protein AB1403_25900 [Candidatus Riflebacteria bacterium]